MTAVPLSAVAQTRSALVLQAAMLALGLASPPGAALAAGCDAGRDAASNRLPMATTVLTDDLIRHHGWQPGVCRLVELPEAEAEAPQPENSSLAAALAPEPIWAGTGY